MKIGELANKSDCTVETIRYYEKEGLLPPALREQANNYRYYDQNHLERLLFIRRCRLLDMSQKEIKSILVACDSKDDSCKDINNIVLEHLHHVQNQIENLKILEKELIKLSNKCNNSGPIDQCGIIHKLEKEPLLTVKKQNKNHISKIC